MTVIAIITPEQYRDDDQIAPTMSRTPGDGGGYVPSRLAGYVYDGAAYCPACASDVTVTSADDDETYTLERFPAFDHDSNGFGVGIVSGTDEWDYPGATCHVCSRTLQTNVLVYEQHRHEVPDELLPD